MKKSTALFLSLFFSAAILFADQTVATDPPTTMVPQLAEEWQVLHHPWDGKYYMNDHTLYQHTDGRWHLIGIGNPVDRVHPWWGETQLVHASADSLLGEWKNHDPLFELPVVEGGDHSEFTLQPKEFYPAWAPHTINYNDECWIFWGPVHFYMAKSNNMIDWEILNHYENGLKLNENFIRQPLNGTNGGADVRDYMVLEISEKRWLMYHTGRETANGDATITVYESVGTPDQWNYVGEALVFRDMLTEPWSSAESPFVFKEGDWYYLSVTYTARDRRREVKHTGGYNQTLLFRSKDPTDFGEFRGDIDFNAPNFVTGLGAHAPEYAYDNESESWYVTTCGWANTPKPLAANGGVAIGRLEWKEAGTFLENHDFEYGTLHGWTATGCFDISPGNFLTDAGSISQSGVGFASSYFKENNIKVGNEIAPSRRSSGISRGTLTSPPFILGGDGKIDFLIMGGKNIDRLYLGVYDAITHELLAKKTGSNSHHFERKEFDLSPYIGKSCYIKVVDNSSKLKWGDISVDDINVPISPTSNI